MDKRVWKNGLPLRVEQISKGLCSADLTTETRVHTQLTGEAVTITSCLVTVR